MVFNLPFLEKKYLGIDLGSINIKVVEVVKKRNGIEVTNFGLIPIINFKEIITSSYILEENISFILKEFFQESKIKAKEAFFNITVPYVFSTNFFIPHIPESSIFNVVRFESQAQLPLSLNEIELEYRYFPFETQDLKQWLIFIAATAKNYLKKIETISKLANLKFSDFSIEYFNFEPYFLNKTGNFLIIDLGHSYSSLTIISNQKVFYATRIKTQGLEFLNRIIELTQYPDEEALNLIKERGFLFNYEEKELNSLTENFLNEIASLIEEQITTIENSFYLKIDKIFWTGGLSILAGFLEKMLSKISKYQQEVLQPAFAVNGEKFSELKEKSTIFTHALGVVLRKLMR